ncbi:flagellar basal body-associated FliL family protein [Sulfurimonas sp.]|uniref:flagellar basal body-associated FliL family protein n=1 Tax=Sulfurimonas sp. TaxID=2022749 RepID=UPI002AAF8C83|nr:flagellar basal body-associated FliL family protein [Sulfurimonas sp.]
MFKKAIKTLILFVSGVIILLILAYGVSQSDFSKIKKYDEIDSSNPRARMNTHSDLKDQIAKERRYSIKPKIKNGNMASLGDFTMNISGGKILTTNISIKYKNNNSNNFLNMKSVEKEIIKKSAVLRDSVINVISHSRNASVANRRMKKKMIENMNNYLSDGEIEDLYFNKFIIN